MHEDEATRRTRLIQKLLVVFTVAAIAGPLGVIGANFSDGTLHTVFVIVEYSVLVVFLVAGALIPLEKLRRRRSFK